MNIKPVTAIVFAIFVAAALIATTVIFVPEIRKMMAGSTLDMEDYCMDAVSEQLLDPDSAQFRKVNIMRLDDELSCTGEVNGKNRLGGYVGFEFFMAKSYLGREWDVICCFF